MNKTFYVWLKNCTSHEIVAKNYEIKDGAVVFHDSMGNFVAIVSLQNIFYIEVR